MYDYPHRRHNPLTGEWVLVSPHRAKRPWLGQVEKLPTEELPSYEPSCYLCPGNERAGGAKNPAYSSTYIFTNDFSALLPDTPAITSSVDALFQAQRIRGTCRVICFSPRHDLTLPEMDLAAVVEVIDVWCTQTQELSQDYCWVQVFENKGAVMGCSNPHPHGQIWAGNQLPNEPRKEDQHQKAYFDVHKVPMLVDYLQEELTQQERLVECNDHWVALIPYWAFWPFEILLLPRRHVLTMPEISPAEQLSLAEILKSLLTKYDNLFETSFPYSMGWHGAPFDAADYSHWQLHAHFFPPLLRSATVKKFQVGYEMLAESQRDLTAEQAADRLRNQSAVHYKMR